MTEDYRHCDTEHLRDYPGCFEECGHDVCTGGTLVAEVKPISLLDQIKEVRGARLRLEVAKLEKEQSFTEWEKANTDLLQEVNSAFAEVTTSETLLRELTVKAYNETGSKTPAPGVGIREVTKLEYDPKEALKWAMSHQIALSLDKKSFEGFAKATPLDFVEVKTEPQATIATDLNKALEEKK